MKLTGLPAVLYIDSICCAIWAGNAASERNFLHCFGLASVAIATFAAAQELGGKTRRGSYLKRRAGL